MSIKNKIRPIVTCLLGLWAMGIGLRFIIGTVLLNLDKEYYYIFPIHDVFFDWMILFVLGGIVWLFHMVDFYRHLKSKKGEKSQTTVKKHGVIDFLG